MAALLAAFVALSSVLSGPNYVDRVRFDNDTEFDIHVEISGDPGDGRLPLGVVIQHCSLTFLDVVDQGSEWTIRVPYPGEGGRGGDGFPCSVARGGGLDVLHPVRHSGPPAHVGSAAPARSTVPGPRRPVTPPPISPSVPLVSFTVAAPRRGCSAFLLERSIDRKWHPSG